MEKNPVFLEKNSVWIRLGAVLTQTSLIITSHNSRLPSSGLGAKRPEQYAVPCTCTGIFAQSVTLLTLSIPRSFSSSHSHFPFRSSLALSSFGSRLASISLPPPSLPCSGYQRHLPWLDPSSAGNCGEGKESTLKVTRIYGDKLSKSVEILNE